MGVIVKNGVWYCGGEGSPSSGDSFKTIKLFTSHWAGKSEDKYELSESYDKYDALQIIYGPKISQEEDGKNRNSVFILTGDLTEGILDISGFKERYVILQFFDDDKTHFKIIANGGAGETNTEYGILSITGIKFGSVSSEGSQKILAIDTLYSEEEKIVGGWVDGKPIYQKTYSNNGSALTLPINVSDLNIDKLVNWEAACSDTQEYGSVMWTIDSCSGIDGRSLFIQDNQIKTTGSYYRHFITIQFTKTTDEENSFTYDMIDSTEGLTDEQITALASETVAAAWPQ